VSSIIFLLLTAKYFSEVFQLESQRAIQFLIESYLFLSISGGKISKKKSSTATGMHDNSRSMTRAEEIADIRARAARGEKVSNKEKKVLKKYEESEAEEAALIAEFESGLANFSLSVSGRATDDCKSQHCSQTYLLFG
jgi:hypothetical protein